MPATLTEAQSDQKRTAAEYRRGYEPTAAVTAGGVHDGAKNRRPDNRAHMRADTVIANGGTRLMRLGRLDR